MPLAMVAPVFLLLATATSCAIALLIGAIAGKSAGALLIGEPAGQTGQALLPTPEIRLVAALLTILLAILLGWFTPTWPRRLVLGGAIATTGILTTALLLGPFTLQLKCDTRLITIGRLACCLVPWSLALAFLPDPDWHAELVLGVAIGSMLPAITAAAYQRKTSAIHGAMLSAQLTDISGAILAGNLKIPVYQLGEAFPLVLTAAFMLAMVASVLVLPHQPLFSTFLAIALSGGLAYLLAFHVFRLENTLFPVLWGIGSATISSALVALIASDTAQSPAALITKHQEADYLPPLFTIALVILNGGVLLLVNRLYGVAGIGLAALAFLPLTMSKLPCLRWLATLLMAIFTARLFLYLFLERAQLQQSGIAIDQPYTFAMLVAGFLVPHSCERLRQLTDERARLLPVLAVLLLTALPFLLGYLLQLLPLAAFLTGCFASTLVSGLSLQRAEQTVSFLAPLLLWNTIAAVIIAPYLVKVSSMPTGLRITAFLLFAVIASLYAILAVRKKV
ncbi:MAG: hypothetical protein HY692_05590 [Cyanobacteria bacterium NC_groundwater_1444_Ag_S-0.65um_54_12]|nr:hypothetical protein [Cyanobacteria bacterium NC_groundwater_1444_Ag_S-0.65um_54_12]